LFQVVGEALASREELLVAAQAGIERVTPRVHETGGGQGEREQAEVREVVRHLVDKVRRATAIAPCLLVVAPAELEEVVGRERAHRFRVALATAALPVDVADEAAPL